MIMLLLVNHTGANSRRGTEAKTNVDVNAGKTERFISKNYHLVLFTEAYDGPCAEDA